MSCSFYIVDDDRSVRKMLAQIIQSHFDGAIVHQNDSPWMSVQDILRLQSDLVILDLLMDDMDGIEVAKELRDGLYKGRIIMLSEVTDKEMVEKAYAVGVDDYISKPINVTEVCKVLQRNIEHLQLKSYVRLIGSPERLAGSLAGMPGSTVSPSQLGIVDQSRYRSRITSLYKELGVVGEPGTEELAYWACACLSGQSDLKGETLNLSDLYLWLKNNFPGYQQDGMSLKGIEQRLRRLVIMVTENLAHMGIEDFSSFRFERYSTALFNFKTIKLEMDFLRGRSDIHGKVDVKRFLDGFLSLME